MSARVFVPSDSSAVSVGADIIAGAIANEARRRGLDIEIVRTGSRGLFWLEPLVEVETPAGRVGYGPLAPGETAQLFEAGFLRGGAHPKALGRVDDAAMIIEGGRITAVGPAGVILSGASDSDRRRRAEIEEIDLRDCVIVPGLVVVEPVHNIAWLVATVQEYLQAQE